MEMNTVNESQSKSIRLRTLFLKYLAVFCAGTIGLLLLLVALFSGLLYTGTILPANHAEKQVQDAISGIQAGLKLQETSSPVLYLYARYSSNGQLADHTLSPKQANQAWELLKHQQKAYRFPHTYVKITQGSETYIFRYAIMAQFSNKVARTLLPSPEWCLPILFCTLFLVGAALLSSSFGRRLVRHLKAVEEAAAHIREQNLDFTVQHSGILEMDQVLQSMEQMKTALKSSLEQQWQLERGRRAQISALAHDVKTPLTIIRGNADLLSETVQTEEQQDYTTYIASGARQIENYIKTLIEMAKADNAVSFHPASFNLHEFLNRIEIQMHALAGVEPFTYEVRAGDLPDTLHADAMLLERALLNTLTNAVEHSPENGKVILDVELDQKALRLRITDEGPGFSAAALGRAAEPFFMEDASRQSKGHYGMGLSIASSIISLHGGELHIANSAITGGGEVTLKLPLIR
ncbi:HAMP domain-containing sensor histidine kinase [Paenibacillus sanguinis]|uniref:HAMP domain-containing sensor histidine kinase n=1 Tax=Paenibacillus sanguinis TaxID=225906 RepID=UPI00036CEA78|nr:HAMP domain-containing sensor histidine kinase [Paenibacillus sanguinis]